MLKIVSSKDKNSHFYGPLPNLAEFRCFKIAQCSQRFFSKGSDFIPIKNITMINAFLWIYFHQFNIVLGLSHFKRTKEGPSNSYFHFEVTRFLNNSPVIKSSMGSTPNF